MQYRRITQLAIVVAATTGLAAFAATTEAQTRSIRSSSSSPSAYPSSTYYSVDPFDYAPPPGATVTTSIETRPQFAPFDQGYNLLGGFRPVYQGVPQPIGHEIISTHNGNGYVYRPFYAPSPGYHYTPQGALVIERPGRYPTSTATPYSAAMPYSVVPQLPPAAPVAPHAIPSNPLPPRVQPTGPREF